MLSPCHHGFVYVNPDSSDPSLGWTPFGVYLGHSADLVSKKGSLFCLGDLSCGLPDSASTMELGWCRYEEGAGSSCLGPLFWQQRWERAPWLLISDLALLPSAAGPASGSPSPLLASLTLPARPLQPPLDLKHLLAFHLNGTTPLSLFPNFSTVWAGQEGGGYVQGRGLGKEDDSAGPRCYQIRTSCHLPRDEDDIIPTPPSQLFRVGVFCFVFVFF